jgi:membrane protein required for colicin V production
MLLAETTRRIGVSIESYDIVMLGLLATAGLLGYFKGIIWQIAWIAGICLSSYVALRFSGQLAPLTGQQAPWDRLLAMLGLYVATSLAVWIGFRVVSSAIDAVHLGAFDHQLGLVFGLAKGALICVVVTFFTVTMVPGYRSQITGSHSGQMVARLIGEADRYLPPDIHETINPFLQQFQEQFDAGGAAAAATGMAGASRTEAEPVATSWQAVLDGVTSVAAWAGVKVDPETAQAAKQVSAAADWMAAPAGPAGSPAAGVNDRYAERQSAFGGQTTPAAFQAVPNGLTPIQSGGTPAPQRFPIGAQTPLPVRR